MPGNSLSTRQVVNRMTRAFTEQKAIAGEKRLWNTLIGFFPKPQQKILSAFREYTYTPGLHSLITCIIRHRLKKSDHFVTVFRKYSRLFSEDYRRRTNPRKSPLRRHRSGAGKRKYISAVRPISHKDFIDRHTLLGMEVPPDTVPNSSTTCYFKADMDDVILLQKMTAIEVTIAREPLSQDKDLLAAMEADQTTIGKQLTIRCRPVKNFLVIGADTIIVEIPEINSPIILPFNGKATAIGRCELAIDIWQEQLLLCSLLLQPTCAETKDKRARIQSEDLHPLMKPLTNPVDQLQITEREEGGYVFYEFTLDSPALNIWEEYRSDALNKDQQSFILALYHHIEVLWNMVAGEADEFEQRLREIGAYLFASLIPPALQKVIWTYREKIRALMIISKECLIPWELCLVKDPERTAPRPDDKFLSEMGLTRWMYKWKPTDQLLLRKEMVRTVIPEYKNPKLYLQATAGERTFLETRLHAISVNPLPEDVKKILSQPNGFDLLHFACHASVDPQDPFNGRLLLQDIQIGQSYTYTYLFQLTVQTINPFAYPPGPRPIIVVNACQAGKLTNQLAGIGGFAKAFLDAGAGVFMSSLWNIEDEIAFVFIKNWYDHLLAGKTLAEATRYARKAARERNGATYLAYAVYGHPDARIVQHEMAMDQSS